MSTAVTAGPSARTADLDLVCREKRVAQQLVDDKGDEETCEGTRYAGGGAGCDVSA